MNRCIRSVVIIRSINILKNEELINCCQLKQRICKLTEFEFVVETSSDDDEDVVSFESFLTDMGVVLGFGVVADVEGDRGFADVVDEFC